MRGSSLIVFRRMQIWENTTKDIEDIPEKIVLLKKQAQSRFDRIRKEAMQQVLVVLVDSVQQCSILSRSLLHFRSFGDSEYGRPTRWSYAR